MALDIAITRSYATNLNVKSGDLVVYRGAEKAVVCIVVDADSQRSTTGFLKVLIFSTGEVKEISVDVVDRFHGSITLTTQGI